MKWLESNVLLLSALVVPLATALCALFVDDITPLETIKLCLLEASVCLLLDNVVGIRKGFKDPESTELLELLSKDKVQGEQLRRSIRNLGESGAHGHPLIQEHIRSLLEEFVFRTEDLARGQISADVQPKFLFRETDGFKHAKNKVCATSMVNSKRYWSTTWGEAYLERNRQLIKGGTRVVRVFIESRSKVESLKEVVLAQVDAGVLVKICFIEEISGEFQRDYMVIDDAILVQLELDREGLPVRTQIVVDELRAAKANKEFKELLKYGHEPQEVFNLSKRQSQPSQEQIQRKK